jgi:hypothetical protein
MMSYFLLRAKYGDLVGAEVRGAMREGGSGGSLCEIGAGVSFSKCESARVLMLGLILIACEEGAEADLDAEARKIGWLDRRSGRDINPS